MTCEDCIHFVVCDEVPTKSADNCDFFKDRSRFVELPCRVGDKVYCGSFGKLMEDEIICITIDVNETRVVLKRGISYDIDKINQMFFLTREQALKERE